MKAFVRALLVASALVVIVPGSASGANVFAGANGTIAFVNDEDGFAEIVAVQPDGSGRVNLTSNRPPSGPNFGTRDGFPSWSPDGSRIAFARRLAGSGQFLDIYTMNPDGSGLAQLTNTSGEGENGPTYSPNGARIAFTGGTSDSDVRLMNSDGSGVTPVTSGSQEDYAPSFSPVDDNAMLFLRGAGINRVNADGSGLTPLRTTDFNSSASYSPDGAKIVFSSAPAGPDDEHVFVMNADGTNVTQLTFGPTRDLHPTFSPDGTRIAFSRVDGINGRIAMIPAAGGDVTFITEGPYDFAPAWQALNPPHVDFDSDGTVDAADYVVWRVTFGEASSYDATGFISGRGSGKSALRRTKVKLKPASGDVAAGATEAIRLKIPKKGKKLLAFAAKEKKKVKISVTVTATDALGASSTESLTSKVKPKR